MTAGVFWWKMDRTAQWMVLETETYRSIGSILQVEVDLKEMIWT